MMGCLVRNAGSGTGCDAPQPVIGLGGTDTRFWRARGVPAFVHGCSPAGMGAADESVGIEEFRRVLRTHALAAFDYARVVVRLRSGARTLPGDPERVRRYYPRTLGENTNRPIASIVSNTTAPTSRRASRRCFVIRSATGSSGPQVASAPVGPQDCQPSGILDPDIGFPAKTSPSQPSFSAGSGVARVWDD